MKPGLAANGAAAPIPSAAAAFAALLVAVDSLWPHTHRRGANPPLTRGRTL